MSDVGRTVNTSLARITAALEQQAVADFKERLLSTEALAAAVESKPGSPRHFAEALIEAAEKGGS